MRRLLGTLLIATVLISGCGEEKGLIQTDPTPVGVTVSLPSATAAGGEVTTQATRLPDEQAVREYVEPFRSEELQREVLQAAEEAEVPAGQELAAAVVMIGCEVPTEVSTSVVGDQVQIVAKQMPSPTKQCLAAITTVALVVVDEASAG